MRILRDYFLQYILLSLFLLTPLSVNVELGVTGGSCSERHEPSGNGFESGLTPVANIPQISTRTASTSISIADSFALGDSSTLHSGYGVSYLLLNDCVYPSNFEGDSSASRAPPVDI